MDTLESHIPGEQARMKAVFESLKIQGLTKKVLLDSATQYKGVIDKDRTNFENAVKNKVAAEVESRLQTKNAEEASVREKEATIKQLQKEIEESKAEISRLSKEIDEEKGKIQSAQSGYLLACEAMINKIDQDLDEFGKIFGTEG